MDFKYYLFLFLVSSGLISLSKTILNFLSWTWSMFFRPPKNLLDYGSWALITGPTDGIGKAIAFELASKGLNLVLVGRNPLKLEGLQDEIRRIYGEKVQLKPIVIDFAESSVFKIVGTVNEAVKELDVGILINNVGLAYPYAKFFHEVDSEMVENLVKVNTEAAIWVTWSILPRMLERKKGAIVNIGSGSSGVVSSYPLYSIYAATKAFLAMFSRCISLEYKEYGIDVQCQIPLLVATKMASIKRPSLFIPSAETFAKSSVRRIGYEQICVPYWPHAVQKFMFRLIPDALLDWCLFNYFLGMRQRGMLRDLRKANLENRN